MCRLCWGWGRAVGRRVRLEVLLFVDVVVSGMVAARSLWKVWM